MNNKIKRTVRQDIIQPMKQRLLFLIIINTNLPRMMPLGWAGGCQMSRTEVVLTSGKRIPTGGPGTAISEITHLVICKRITAQSNFPMLVCTVYLGFKIPSSSVRSKSGGELEAPSPIRVKPRTWISYRTYLSRPVSWTLWLVFPSTVQKQRAESESFSRYATYERQSRDSHTLSLAALSFFLTFKKKRSD